MDPLVKLDDDLSRAEPGRELGDQRGREDRDVPPPRGRQVDERRPGHGRGLRVVVEADGLARARRRLRVPVLRHRGRRRSTTAARRRTATRSPTRWASTRSTTTTLEVKLTSAQPWFIQQAAHHFVPRRPPPDGGAVRRRSGPRRRTSSPTARSSSTRWEHNSRIDLVKNEEWRDADSVELDARERPHDHRRRRPPCRRSRPARSTSTGGLPVEEIPRLKETEDYEQYPALGTYYYGFNVKNITDVNQRRAMSLAINRREIIDNIAQADQLPTTRLHAEGHAGLRRRSTRTRRGSPRTATSSRRSS